eukprot:Skav220700  [mRNA]  locus=scaffold472:685335:686837:+ [translate_table: standard]
MHYHEEYTWLKVCQWLPNNVGIHPEIKRVLNAADQPGTPLNFYTDGSCKYPQEPGWRPATYAVVLDLARSDAEREAIARDWSPSQPLPTTFMPLVYSHATKLQSIPRAELEALVFVVENFQHTQVFSDSQCALQLADKCAEHTTATALEMHPDADLLGRFWRALQYGQRAFRKVKAHDLDKPQENMLEKYHKMGNQAADQAAKKALDLFQTHILNTSNTIHNDQTIYRDKLHEYYTMLLQMFRHRATLDASEDKQPNRAVAERVHATYVQDLCDLQVPDPWQPPPLVHDHADQSSWGPTLSRLLVEWMAQVHWPQEDPEGNVQCVGVTWVELALSLCLYMGTFIPTKRFLQDDKPYLVHFTSQTQAEATGLKLSEQADSLQKWITQIHGLQHPQQWPNPARGLVRSLYTLGAHHQSSGFYRRPSFPFQERVLKQLQEYLTEQTGTAFARLPKIDFHLAPAILDRIEGELAPGWDQMCRVRQEVARQMKRRVQRSERVAGV